MGDISETPLVFETSEGAPLVGILHVGHAEARTAVVMMPADGPQYRVGCCRQLLRWARMFAEDGIAVLRFDFRGMGDSGGEYVGFEHSTPDIRAALDTLQDRLPTLRNIYLWGGCSAASASFMYVGQDPRVTGVVALNPYVRDETLQARAYLKHYYLARLLDRRFWVKLLRGGLDIRGSVGSIIGQFRRVWGPSAASSQEGGMAADTEAVDFVERMRLGLAGFDGRVLTIMSGKSMLGREFDELARSSPAWRKTLHALEFTRIEMADAGHTFSTREDQVATYKAALDWLRRESKES